MNKFKTFLILLVSFILQTTIFSKIDILGANVNIIIPAIVAIGQVLEDKTAGYAGLIVGLIEDFMFTNLMGVRALSYFVIGSFVSSDRFNFGKDRQTGIIMTALSSILHLIIISVIYYLTTGQTVITDYLPIPILIEVILNSLIYLIFIPIVKKVMYIPTYRI